MYLFLVILVVAYFISLLLFLLLYMCLLLCVNKVSLNTKKSIVTRYRKTSNEYEHKWGGGGGGVFSGIGKACYWMAQGETA